MKFIVFGLGNFGCALSSRLTDMGHEVLGIDKSYSKIESLKEQISHTICLDSTDIMAVKTLPLKDADAVIVAIGEDEGASIMTTALLKQMQAKRIISRVMSPLQRMVIEAMGITEFIDPEKETAERMATMLDIKNVVDSFQVSDRYRIMEITVPDRYIGSTIEEADFIHRYRVSILTIMRKEEEKSLFGTSKTVKRVLGVLPPNFTMEADDILVLFGDLKDIETLMR